MSTPSIGGKAAACLGKHPYVSASLAHEVAQRSGRGRNRTKAKVYRCKHCGAFHLGTLAKMPRDRPRFAEPAPTKRMILTS